MSVDFDKYLSLKYSGMNNMQDAQAGLYRTQSQLMPEEQAARARAQQTAANASMLSAQGSNTLANANASHLTAMTPSQIGLTQAQTGLLTEQTHGQSLENNIYADPQMVGRLFQGIGVPVDYSQRTTPATGSAAPATGDRARISTGQSTLTQKSTLDMDENGNPKYPQGHAKGTAQVAGKGSGKVDTVPAMLAPGEAVLNKGAAEHMGRDNIKSLNAVGLLKMGMPAGKPAPKAAPKGKQKFASGTDNVQQAQDVPNVSAMTTGKAVGSFPQQDPSTLHTTQKSVVDTDENGRLKYAKGTSNVPAVDDRVTAAAKAVKGKEPAKGTMDSRVPPKGGQGSMAHYAGGVSHVGKGKKSDTPKLDPKMLQAVMQMLGGAGGGGMPAPQPQQQAPQGVGPGGML